MWKDVNRVAEFFNYSMNEATFTSFSSTTKPQREEETGTVQRWVDAIQAQKDYKEKKAAQEVAAKAKEKQKAAEEKAQKEKKGKGEGEKEKESTEPSSASLEPEEEELVEPPEPDVIDLHPVLARMNKLENVELEYSKKKTQDQVDLFTLKMKQKEQKETEERKLKAAREAAASRERERAERQRYEEEMRRKRGSGDVVPKPSVEVHPCVANGGTCQNGPSCYLKKLPINICLAFLKRRCSDPMCTSLHVSEKVVAKVEAMERQWREDMAREEERAPLPAWGEKESSKRTPSEKTTVPSLASAISRKRTRERHRTVGGTRSGGGETEISVPPDHLPAKRRHVVKRKGE